MTRAAVSVDIGGTFTDLVLLDVDGRCFSRKVPSTPARPEEAVVAGIRQILDDAGLAAADVLHLHASVARLFAGVVEIAEVQSRLIGHAAAVGNQRHQRAGADGAWWQQVTVERPGRRCRRLRAPAGWRRAWRGRLLRLRQR